LHQGDEDCGRNGFIQIVFAISRQKKDETSEAMELHFQRKQSSLTSIKTGSLSILTYRLAC
jgi:hypothetical protein